MRLPAGLALKAPREELMDQCKHSDGLRDRGGQKTDHAGDSLATFCTKGQPAVL